MNIYLAAAGVMSLGLALTHAFWGEKNLVGKLMEFDLESLTSLGFYVSYHQITSVLIINGLGLFNAAMSTDPTITFMLSVFILAIIIGNFGVFMLISFRKDPSILKMTLPQTVLFVIKIMLIIVGIVVG